MITASTRVFRRVLSILAVAIAVATAPDARALEPPPIDDHVTDPANRLTDAQEKDLEATLAAFRTSTGHEIAVFVPASLGGDTVEDVAYRTFNSWKLGREAEDDGVLFVIAPVERKIRIETGRGVGDRLPDVVAARIIREHVVPHMKAEDLDGALRDGLAAIMAALRAQALPAPLPVTSAAAPSEGAAGAAAAGPTTTPWVPAYGPQTRRQAIYDAENEYQRRRDDAEMRAYERKEREDAQTPFVVAGLFAAVIFAIMFGIWLKNRRHRATHPASSGWESASSDHRSEHGSSSGASSFGTSSSSSSFGSSSSSGSGSSGSSGGFKGGGGSSGGGGASGSY